MVEAQFDHHFQDRVNSVINCTLRQRTRVSQIAIWLTVSLAVWRWVVVSRPHAALTLCTTPRARRLLFAVYLACPVVSIPTFFLYTVKEIPVSDDNPSKKYIVDMSSNKLLKEVSMEHSYSTQLSSVA